MRFLIILTLVAAASLAVNGLVTAEEQAGQDSTATEVMEFTNQTHCPVMGGKIDSTVYTDIQGQRVYHCCAMCSSKLKSDPDKYFKKAAEEGILFENIQTSCPVSGVELETKDVYTDFEGRRVYFCCEKCPEVFGKDPQKYLKKMDQAPQSDDEGKTGEEAKMGHGGHGH